MTHNEMLTACSLVAMAIPFGLFLSFLALSLRATWERWP